MIRPASEQPTGLEKVERTYNSDAIAEALREQDFHYIPLTPGSSYRGLHDSIVNYLGNEKPQMVLCLHEAVAVSVAHGYTKAARSPCPVLLHDLVGLMNGSMAIYNAFCDDAPVVIIGGGGPNDRAGERRPIDWLHSAETQAEVIRDFVKWTDEPTSLYGALSGVYRARQLAVSAPTGPTYVTLDVEMQEELIPGTGEGPDPLEYEPAPPIAADRELVRRAAECLLASTLPVVAVGGRTAEDPAVTPVVTALIEAVGAACLEAGSVACASEHPLCGVADRALLGDADVVLVAGVRDPAAILDRGNRDQVVIDLSLGDLKLKAWSNAYGKPYRRSIQLLADPLGGLRDLLDAVRELRQGEREAAAGRRRAAVEARIVAAREAQQRDIDRQLSESHITPAHFTTALWKAVSGREYVLANRSGRVWQEGIWRFDRAGRMLHSLAGGGIGYGPGAAVGAALAARDRGEIAVAVVGDGDFTMANTALWTAARHRLPLLMVINDNLSYGNDEEHQRRTAATRGRPLANASIGVGLDDPAIDYSAQAHAFGCWAESPVSDPGGLEGAFSRAINAVDGGRVAVVSVRTQLAPGGAQ